MLGIRIYYVTIEIMTGILLFMSFIKPEILDMVIEKCQIYVWKNFIAM